MSPDSPEPEDSYTLTPRTEAKYNKIDEDFQIMMQRNQQLSASGRVNMAGNSYSLPVSVPVIGTYNDSSMMQSSPQMAHNSISPRPSSSETDSGEYFLGYHASHGVPGTIFDEKNVHEFGAHYLKEIVLKYHLREFENISTRE